MTLEGSVHLDMNSGLESKKLNDSILLAFAWVWIDILRYIIKD